MNDNYIEYTEIIPVKRVVDLFVFDVEGYRDRKIVRKLEKANKQAKEDLCCLLEETIYKAYTTKDQTKQCPPG